MSQQRTLSTFGFPYHVDDEFGGIYMAPMDCVMVNPEGAMRSPNQESVDKFKAEFIANDYKFKKPLVVIPQLIDGELKLSVADGSARFTAAKQAQEEGHEFDGIKVADMRDKQIRDANFFDMTDDLKVVCDAMNADNFVEIKALVIKMALRNYNREDLTQFALDYFLN
ncbi:TPA: hypothetical protein I7190_04235 [Vibrio vulnificus]|nr:hypothetical protein [Vibrio vulnificus]